MNAKIASGKMAKNLRSIEPSEHQIQSAIVEWCNLNNIPGTQIKIIDYLLKITNEGTGSIFRGIKSKKEGLKKGVSDLLFSYPSKFYDKSSLWIEVKAKNGKLGKLQKEWLDKMNSCGCKAIVVRSVEEGIQAIKDYLGMK